MRIIRLLKVRILAKNKRFTMDNPNDWGFPITDNDTGKVYSCASNQLMKDLCDVINNVNELAEANEEQCLKIMTYLHDKHYEIWEEVNRECFNDRE